MPILKARIVANNQVQNYPKSLRIEVEKIAKEFEKIKQIDVSDALYLLR